MPPSMLHVHVHWSQFQTSCKPERVEDIQERLLFGVKLPVLMCNMWFILVAPADSCGVVVVRAASLHLGL